jgi:hypothetical protein
MKARIATLLLAIVCAAPNAHGQGAIRITFDGPPEASPGSSVSLQSYSEGGISFAPIPPQDSFSRVGVGFPGDPQDGSAYLRAALTQSLSFDFIDGSIFSVLSVDLAEYSAAFQYPITVHFIGYRPGGSTVMTDFTTDGVIDGTGPLADFQTFYFDNEWSGLSRVEIPTWGWSLDNLVVSIPEPASLTVLVLGALICFARIARGGTRS